MKLTLRQQLTQFSTTLQSKLFPILKDELGELSTPAKRLVATLEMIPLARFIPSSRGWIGRPSKDRLAIANAFVAKSVYGFSLTRQLLDALAIDTAHLIAPRSLIRGRSRLLHQALCESLGRCHALGEHRIPFAI